MASSLVLIVAVLLQEGKNYGMGSSIGGSQESLFGKTRSRGLQATLQRITVIAASTLMLSLLIFTIFVKPSIF
jgi:preprotein translocase subunit SecG